MKQESGKRDKLYYEFLPDAIEIEETPPRPAGRIVIWLIASIIVISVIWATIGKVDIVVESRGKIIPDGRIKVVQPLEEGTIKAIHVEEGQRVEANQLLMELDPTIKQADQKSIQRELLIATLEKNIILAELNGESAVHNVVSEIDSEDLKTKELLTLQQNLKSSREQEFVSKKESLLLEIEQKKKELEIEKSNLELNQRDLELLLHRQDEKSLKATDPNDLLDQSNEILSSQEKLEIQQTKVILAQDALKEAEKNVDVLIKERNKTILQELMEKEKTITNLEAELKKANKQVDSQELRSPVKGTVHGIASFTIGGVVTPAEALISVVPEDTPLLVEAHVTNKDIGYIHKGDLVEIKVDTYPFQKYGTLPGEITFISPDSIDDKKLGTVFKIKVSLKKAYLGDKERKITSGMTLTAEVKVGKRRIIEFFLSPITKSIQDSVNKR